MSGWIQQILSRKGKGELHQLDGAESLRQAKPMAEILLGNNGTHVRLGKVSVYILKALRKEGQ